MKNEVKSAEKLNGKIVEYKIDRHPRVATYNTEPSRTQQQFAEECDVNAIMRKYEKTGELTHLNKNPGMYADLTSVGDYHSSLNKIIAAEEAFMALSAETRLKFENDPGKLLEFIQDPKNTEEAVNMGLIPETKTPETKNQTKPNQTKNPNPSEKPNQTDPTPEPPKTST